MKRLLSLVAVALGLVFPTASHADLTVAPLTWNIIGLDSNKVTVGPNHFPVGARVCNTSAGATTAIADFVWDDGLGIFAGDVGADAYVNLRAGTNDSLTLLLAAAGSPGDCADAYFEAEVTRDAAAYNNARRYHITATDTSGTVSTSIPRELFVEHLVSQARNSVLDMQLSTDGSAYTSIAAGGTLALTVGNTYWIRLVAATATNGYEQIESFINFPNTIFQVLSVDTTYTAESSGTMTPPYNTLYGDGCVWEPDPNSPNYSSCLSTGKAGGGIAVTYQVTILSVPGAPLVNPEPLGTLIYDFSGSSFHYNGDYGVSSRFAQIIDPTNVGIAKSFSPNPVSVNGVSALTITLSNPNPGPISGLNFVDVFPTSPGAMTVAAPLTTSNTCGGTLQDSGGVGALAAADVGLKLVAGTIPANSSCIVKVNVTVPAVGTYTNTTNELYVGPVSTGQTATTALAVDTAPPPPSPPSSCTNPVELARWEIPTTGQGSSSGTTPPPYTTKAADVATATTNYFSTASPPLAAGVSSIEATGGVAPNSWGGTAPVTVSNPPLKTAGWVETATSTANYFEFTLDTHNYGGVYVNFNAGLFTNGDWASPISNVFVNTSADGGAFTVYTTSPAPTYPRVSKGGWNPGLIAAAATTGTSTTVFRFSFDGGSKEAALAQLDDIIFSGCRKPDPPSITKSFSPNPVAVGGTSTLTFTVTNPNAAGQTLNGINVSDFLPQEALQGTVALTSGSPAVVGTGTAFKTQLIAGGSGSIVFLPSALTGTLTFTSNSMAVTGSGTAFSSELVVGSIISFNSANYTVASITDNTNLTLASTYTGTTQGSAASVYTAFTVSSITDDTNLTLSSNYSGSTAGNLTMLAGLTFVTSTLPATTCGSAVQNVVSGGRALRLSGNSLTGTLGLTNASTTVTGTSTLFTKEVGAGSILLLPYRLVGTVATTSGSTAVVGTGTTFTTQLAVGSKITINSMDYIVTGITDDTHLALSNAPGSTATGLTARGYREYAVSSVTNDTTLVLTAAYASAANLSGLTVNAGLAGGGATCTITALVKANAAGVRANVSEVITSPESGANTTSAGYAAANLTAIVPPVIDKGFAPDPIVTGGISTLTFTITNPNQNDALSGVTFTDVFPVAPGAMTVAAPLTTTNTCGGSLLDSGGGALAASDVGIQLAGGTIAGGGSCTVSVNVTATTTGRVHQHERCRFGDNRWRQRHRERHADRESPESQHRHQETGCRGCRRAVVRHLGDCHGRERLLPIHRGEHRRCGIHLVHGDRPDVGRHLRESHSIDKLQWRHRRLDYGQLALDPAWFARWNGNRGTCGDLRDRAGDGSSGFSCEYGDGARDLYNRDRRFGS